MDPLYIALIAVSLGLGLAAQWWVRRQLKAGKSIPSSADVTGAQIAGSMLSARDVQGVSVRRAADGEDLFDPTKNEIALDPENFEGTSVTAHAVACHEAGHACQHAEGYAPMGARKAVFGFARIAGDIWPLLFIFGVILDIAGLVWAAVIVYASILAFNLITLPIEINASARALAYLKEAGLPEGELKAAAKVLRSCAYTYLVAALASAMQLVYLLGRARR